MSDWEPNATDTDDGIVPCQIGSLGHDSGKPESTAFSDDGTAAEPSSRQEQCMRPWPEGGLAKEGFGFGWKSGVFGLWAAPGCFKNI